MGISAREGTKNWVLDYSSGYYIILDRLRLGTYEGPRMRVIENYP